MSLLLQSAPNIAKQTDSGLGMDGGWQDSRSASVDQLQDYDRQRDRQREKLLHRHKEELRRQQQVSTVTNDRIMCNNSSS